MLYYYFDSNNMRYLGWTDNSSDILAEHIVKQESDLVFTDPISDNMEDHDQYDWWLGDDGVTVTRQTMIIDPPEPETA